MHLSVYPAEREMNNENKHSTNNSPLVSPAPSTNYNQTMIRDEGRNSLGVPD